MNQSVLEKDDDDLLVNFHDALIYRRDLQILKSPTAWLNSDCIHFHLQCLQYSHHRDDVLFMDPSVTSFLVHQCTDDDEIEEFRESHGRFEGKRWVYLPINDSMFAENIEWWATQGTHWSLLRILIPSSMQTLANDDKKCICEHFNSMSGTNQQAAISVSEKMSVVLNLKSNPIRNITGVPQQRNGYDCGLFVLLMIEELLKGSDVDGIAELFRTNPFACADLRRRMAETVLKMSAEMQR